MYSLFAACVVGASLAHASTISVLSDIQVLDFLTTLNGGQPPLGAQGGCSGSRIQEARQAYDDAITVANLANAALTANTIQGRVNNMFRLLFDSAVDGPDDASQIAEFYQVIADTSGTQSDGTPENIILQCEDRLFDELVARGITQGFSDPGDPCDDPDTKCVDLKTIRANCTDWRSAYGFFVADFDNDQDQEDFGALVGEHIVLCTSFL